MRTFARLAFAVAVVVGILLPCRRSHAVSMLLTIDSPRQCPEGLTIKSKSVNDGMVDVDVDLDAEQIAHPGELYQGRVRAHALLNIAAGGQPVASVTVQGEPEGKRTRYHFRLSPAAMKASELQIGVSLYEKDGFPTLGGGVSLQIRLAGFMPAEKATAPKAKP